MISIVLYHNHYNSEHLQNVKEEMRRLGAHTINCWYDESNDIWFAVEGCHRLRAAYALGITPIINDISNDDTLTYEVDGNTITIDIDPDFFDDLYDRNYRNIILDFKED